MTRKSTNKDNSKPLVRLGGLVASKALRAWMSTLDYRVVYYDRNVDPASGVGGPRIYIFWHEHILLPLYLRGNCQLSMLLSQHRDADILARVAYHFGFGCIRGSTFRGGARALRELRKASEKCHLTITPDGPRGPRREMAQGPIYLASQLQIPLVVMGFGFDRPWRASSWDRFAFPRPYSRARAIIGPELAIPPRLGRSEIEHYRQRVQRLMNSLTLEAEAWAESGTRKQGEVAAHPQAAPLPPLAKDSHTMPLAIPPAISQPASRVA